jgi:hypothetical protein
MTNAFEYDDRRLIGVFGGRERGSGEPGGD